MAVRITLKRSSIFNKRPTPDLLDPGELALNTNALSPGLFFETENNRVVKVGPTAVGTEYPTPFPSLGEMSYNPVNNSLSIGDVDPETAAQVWREVSAPYLGGTNGYVVFVAPEFPTSNDDLKNDGQSAPYKSLNRAVLEIAKQSIVRQNESDAYQNNRYTIFVQPGTNTVFNGPGKSIATTADPEGAFGVNFDESPDVNPDILTEFNPVTGGLIVPRGTSIQGLDLRKTILAPTYVPTFKVPGSSLGTNEPITSILKWTGNSYVTELTFKDKPSVALVNKFGTYKDTNSAVFYSIQPHGFAANDKVFFEYSPGANRIPTGTGQVEVLSGDYYTYPLSVDSFLLSYTPITAETANYVERTQLPADSQGLAFTCSVTWKPYSHHRLRCFSSASLDEMNEFYLKVQAAFPTYFDGKSNQAEVINPGETEIVAPTPNIVPSLISNSNRQGSPYAFNVSLRSSYGLCGAEADGRVVTGFKSSLFSQFTVASIQNDPFVYEVYTTIYDNTTQKSVTTWYPLPVATWASIDNVNRPSNAWLVPTEQMLAYLNEVPVINVRYAYTSQVSPDNKTYGLPDLNNDYRHFGIRASNDAYVQVDTAWTVGPAVGFWALNGARMSVTNSTSNFGSIAVRTEGFAGIGTLGGALPQDQGFRFGGIRMPLKLTQYGVANFNIYSLGVAVKEVTTDLATGVQTVLVGPGFEPITLLPYSLAPGTALWVQSSVLEFRGFFVNDGLPTAVFLPNGDCQLRLRFEDSTIPNGGPEVTKGWDPPFIKRFQDPRTVMEQSYALILDNTSPGHRDPVVGNILRLQQTSNNNNQALTVRPGVQFDPGQTGGWGRVFQVAFSQTSSDGDAPQYNETLLNRPISSSYYTALLAVDNSRPWLETYDKPHGAYVTFQNRNWYATCNDQWNGVYFSTSTDVQTAKKLIPTSYVSPYANTLCLENQYAVNNTFQGQFGGDPTATLYETGTYLRGSSPARSNYDFSDYYNGDNGSPNFGLLRNDISAGVNTPTTQVLKPTETTIFFSSVVQISGLANPKKTFVVLSLTDDSFPDKKEYVQVTSWNLFDNSATVIRGLYGTTVDFDWPVDTAGTLQAANTVVNPLDYDLDWAPTKYAMIRFLQVMGYSNVDIQTLLQPQSPSSRNRQLANISIQPKGGYALNTGPWNMEFNLPSSLNCAFHQFYSVGYFNYSRGLPKYLESNLNTKQYYDFISTAMWGGYFTLFGQNESGSTIVEGELTQALTGRPYGSLSSDITNFPRYKVDRRQDEEEQSYVRVVDTGAGLTGGPITDIGSISLIPATTGSLGGVIVGDFLSVTPSGVLSLDASRVGTVRGVTAGIGLGAPNTGNTITETGTINLLPPTATTIGGVLAGEGVQISISGVLGLKPPTVSTLGGVKPGPGVDVSPEGALVLLPPTATQIGGVKAGPGIVIDPDGTIKLADGPSGVVRIDPITFNGTQTDFQLLSGGQPFTPENSTYLLVVVGGITQPSPDAYTVNGSTLSFTNAPPAGASFYGIAFL
jgi:hypothetical protein